MAKVFISYRRVDATAAHLVAAKLRERLDAEIITDHDIDESHFPAFIERAISEWAVFVSIVTPNTFAPERIHHPDDWIRKETDLALRLKPTASGRGPGRRYQRFNRDQLRIIT